MTEFEKLETIKNVLSSGIVSTYAASKLTLFLSITFVSINNIKFNSGSDFVISVSGDADQEAAASKCAPKILSSSFSACRTKNEVKS